MWRIIVGMVLTDRERALLDFEQKWFKQAGAKEAAIRAEFDLSAIGYWQLILALVQREDALAYAPLLVNRIRRQLAQKRHRVAG